MKDTFTLQILHTSDIHGYIYPTSYSTKQEQHMGLAKLQTLITKIKQPQHLLIDTGDIIQGSPLTYHYAKQGRETIHPMAKVMNHMNYHYITIGNHEFNYGLSNLNHYLDYLDATILNANLLQSTTHQPYRGITHDIKCYPDGPTIGIIGVTTHYIPNWEQPSHIQNIEIIDAFTTTQQLAKQLRPTVDILIVNYHGGFERDFTTYELSTEDTGENQGFRMLQDIPEIDILLTGHQHRLLHGSLFNTTYSQPGFNAQHLVEINIEGTFDNTWTFTTKTTLHNTTSVLPDKTIMALVESEETATQTYLDTPVGHLDKDYLITNQTEARLHKHPLVSFINQVQLDYTGAEIASCSLGNDVSGFKKDITIRDVISTYIYPNTIVVKQMTGAELKRALEKTATFFTIKHDTIVISDEYNDPKLQLYAYDMYDPIHYTITVSNPIGERVSEITLDGKPLELQSTYSVVMNNYRASGGGDYLFIKDCPILEDPQIEIIEILVDYILKKNQITINHHDNITIVK